MTDKRRLELEEKLNIAEATGDDATIEAVKKTMEREYRECTAHTAERLKRVESTVVEIKNGLIPAEMYGELQTGLKGLSEIVQDLRSQIDAWKNQVKGARIFWVVLRYLVAIGGGGILVKLLSATTDATSSGIVP